MDRRLLGQVCQQTVTGNLVLAAAGGKFQHVRIGLGDTAGDDIPLGSHTSSTSPSANWP